MRLGRATLAVLLLSSNATAFPTPAPHESSIPETLSSSDVAAKVLHQQQKRDMREDTRRYGALAIPGTVAALYLGTSIVCIFRRSVCSLPGKQATAPVVAARAPELTLAEAGASSAPTITKIDEERLVAPLSPARRRPGSVAPDAKVPSSPASRYHTPRTSLSGLGELSWASPKRTNSLGPAQRELTLASSTADREMLV